METSHTITFHPNGTATTLYTDRLPLRELLGTLTVERASAIEFNNETQQWDVFLLPAENLPPEIPKSSFLIPNFSHPSREECLRWEHKQLNQ